MLFFCHGHYPPAGTGDHLEVFLGGELPHALASRGIYMPPAASGDLISGFGATWRDAGGFLHPKHKKLALVSHTKRTLQAQHLASSWTR
jgi:hypothetical protein